MITKNGGYLPDEMVNNYMQSLTGQFFKILPMKESNSCSLHKYIASLQRELIGCKNLMVAIKYDSQFLCLISILQYLIDHPECNTKDVKSEVFKCIDMCKKLQQRYGEV